MEAFTSNSMLQNPRDYTKHWRSPHKGLRSPGSFAMHQASTGMEPYYSISTHGRQSLPQGRDSDIHVRRAPLTTMPDGREPRYFSKYSTTSSWLRRIVGEGPKFITSLILKRFLPPLLINSGSFPSVCHLSGIIKGNQREKG